MYSNFTYLNVFLPYWTAKSNQNEVYTTSFSLQIFLFGQKRTESGAQFDFGIDISLSPMIILKEKRPVIWQNLTKDLREKFSISFIKRIS